MEPAMFSLASMFGSESEDDEDNGFVERDHTFPGLVLRIREFAFHQVNANLVWPGACIFAEWIVGHEELVKGRRVLELGSGTGALAIFLKKTLELDITTSDYDDLEIENNIRSNCQLNGLGVLPHIRHTWGEDFPYKNPDWDLIIASDILLYVKQYPSLIQTLCFLLAGYNVKCTQITRPNALATEPHTTDIQTDDRSHSSVRAIQSPDSLGIKSLSGAVAGSSVHSSDLIKESQTLCTDSSAMVTLSLFGDYLDKPCAHRCLSGADIQASTLSMKSKVAEVSCLPRPCFLMSWRRRIPKQDEAVFFEGCKTAGLGVIDFGSRVYCIHRIV